MRRIGSTGSSHGELAGGEGWMEGMGGAATVAATGGPYGRDGTGGEGERREEKGHGRVWEGKESNRYVGRSV